MIVSLIGTWMQSVSQPWLVLLLGGTPLQLGSVLALQFLPSMILAPFGGVLADRVDKRRVLILTQAAAMLQAFVLFGLTVTEVVQIWHVMVLALGLGIVNAIDMPLRQSFAPDLVPREDLMNAIALNAASFNFGRVIGPAVAGITLAIYGPAFNFAINAVSYLAVLLALARMDPARITRPVVPEQHPSVRTSLMEGIRYARRTPGVLWPLVLLGGVSTFGMNFQTLLPLFARDTLFLGADGYGALFAAMGVGTLVGSLSLAFLAERRRVLLMIMAGGVGFVAFEVLLGLSRTTLAAFPLIMALGLCSMLMVNSINVMIQHRVPNELRGRVMALYVTVFAGSTPIGGLLAGAIAQAWGAPTALVVGAGLASLVLGLVAWQLVVLGKARTDIGPSPVRAAARGADAA